MSSKYLVGTRLKWKVEEEAFLGSVVPNIKFPGDICVQWDIGTFSSYDEDFLDENVTIHEKVSVGD